MYPSFDKIKTRWEDVKPGDWFFPMTIKGMNQHNYIGEAIARGAAGFSFEKGYVSPHSIPGREVPCLREELFTLAQKKREQITGKIAVIGGSAGKTTVKELLASLLRSHSTKSFASPENQNTKIALASQILALPQNCDFAAFEVGARRVGDFSIPLNFLRPDVVALLNIGRAHLGEFGSVPNLRATKLSLLESSASTLVLPYGTEIQDFAKNLKDKKIITFGHSKEADIILLKEDLGRVQILWCEESFELKSSTPCFGINLAASVALAEALGLPRSLDALANYQAPRGRFTKTIWRGREVIDDAFNASPESMEAGLRYFSQLAENRKAILVLGGILELGEESERIHQELGLLARKLFAGSILCVGTEAKAMAEGAQAELVSDAKEARQRLEKENWELAYIKGSKAIGLHKLLE